MKRDNVKVEIQKIIDTVPDDKLQDIHKILKDYSDKNPDSMKLYYNLNKILTEDKGLLERLAK